MANFNFITQNKAAKLHEIFILSQLNNFKYYLLFLPNFSRKEKKFVKP